MTDDAVAIRILKFMRQMNIEDSEEALREAAIARKWLDAGGAPTSRGRSLVVGFDDLEKLSTRERLS